MNINRILSIFCLTAYWVPLNVFAAANAPLELEQILALDQPICIDMRIQSERQKASSLIKTKSLHTKFRCRKTYVLPLSVRPTEEMLLRYSDKINRMNGEVVLAWCSEGQRSQMIAEKIDASKVHYFELKGGTSYFKQVLELQ